MRQLCDYSRHCRNTRTSPQPSRRVRDWNPVPTHEPLQGHGAQGAARPPAQEEQSPPGWAQCSRACPDTHGLTDRVARAPVHRQAQTCAHVHGHTPRMQVCTRAHAEARTQTQVHTYRHACACTQLTYMQVCTHTHGHMCEGTHIQTRLCSKSMHAHPHSPCTGACTQCIGHPCSRAEACVCWHMPLTHAGVCATATHIPMCANAPYSPVLKKACEPPNTPRPPSRCRHQVTCGAEVPYRLSGHRGAPQTPA